MEIQWASLRALLGFNAERAVELKAIPGFKDVVYEETIKQYDVELLKGQSNYTQLEWLRTEFETLNNKTVQPTESTTPNHICGLFWAMNVMLQRLKDWVRSEVTIEAQVNSLRTLIHDIHDFTTPLTTRHTELCEMIAAVEPGVRFGPEAEGQIKNALTLVHGAYTNDLAGKIIAINASVSKMEAMFTAFTGIKPGSEPDGGETTYFTTLPDLIKYIEDALDIIEAQRDFLAQMAGFQSEMSFTVGDTSTKYNNWISNLTAAVAILRQTTESSIMVSSDVTAIIKAAQDVSQEIKGLMSDTSSFQIWLTEKMDLLRSSTDIIGTLTSALAKNLELKEAQTPEDREQRLAEHRLQEKNFMLEIANTAISAIPVAKELLTPPPQEIRR